MKRVFFATNPDLIYRVIPDWYNQSVADFDNWPLVGFNAEPGEPGLFEPLKQNVDYSLFLVNDKHKDDLLAGMAIGSDDYLIYHENTRNPIINKHFRAENRMPSIHEDNPSLSKYAQAFAIIQDNEPQKAERIVEAVFLPKRRMIECFLSRLNDKVPPNLPDVLSPLREDYELLKMDKVKHADQWQSFVNQCIKIYDSIN